MKPKAVVDKTYSVLVGDIGGTNIRLGILKMTKKVDAKQESIDKTNFKTIDFKSLDDVLENYLKKYKGSQNYPIYAVIGVPGQIKNNEAEKGIFASCNWPKANGDEIAKKFGLKKFLFLNDFTCNSYAIQTNLKEGEDYIVINKGQPIENGPKVIIGPGTGIGVGFLIKDEASPFYTIGASEGGLIDFNGKDDRLYGLRKFMKEAVSFYKKYDNVPIGGVLSNRVLVLIYSYLLTLNKDEEKDPELAKIIYGMRTNPNPGVDVNKEIIDKGLSGKCKLSKKVLELFIEVYGNFAGDVSLLYLPSNGLYLAGGLSIALEPLIKGTNIFMDHFTNKILYNDLLKTFPVYLVKNNELGLIGAAECAKRLILKEK